MVPPSDSIEPRKGGRDDRQHLKTMVSESPLLGAVLDHWNEIQLPDCWLAAGAVAQTVWNHRLGHAPDYGINDIDIVYFDPDNLTKAAEDAEERRIHSVFADTPVAFDVKNEARVHLWYASRFGQEIAPYRSTRDAIATFPTTATAIGVRKVDRRFEISAPYGLDDLHRLIVRPNKVQITEPIYRAKVARWRNLWPALDIRDWNDDR